MPVEITLQTKIADLLKAYPQLEDKLIATSSVFIKLKNPVLRRTVAKIATIKQVAEIANLSPTELVLSLRKAVGQSVDLELMSENNDREQKPEWMNINNIKITYNATPIIESGASPMAEILKRADELHCNEIMCLQTPFKPLPIIDILSSKGYQIWYKNENTYIIKLAEKSTIKDT